MKYANLIAVIALLLMASAGFGQTPAGPTVITQSGRSATAGFMAPRAFPPAITGARYSGEETQEHTQTLSDGTHITQSMMRRTVYRDSLGRTRSEHPLTMAPPPGAPSFPTIVEITDPASGVQYTLDTQNKVAHRIMVRALPEGTAQPGGTLRAGTGIVVTSSGGVVSAGPIPPLPSAAARPAFRRPDFTTEKLGTQMIEGVLSEGERQTMTIPEGEQGNDRPLHIITETWTSPDLQLVVLRKTSDLRSGDSIMKVTNINRSEPDLSLFQPPPDYTIVDEAGQFSIRYNN